MPLSALEDTRCDVCLYFIAPHSLRPLDAAMMASIGRLVPVVPIIAKVQSPYLCSPSPCPQQMRALDPVPNKQRAAAGGHCQRHIYAWAGCHCQSHKGGDKGLGCAPCQ